MKLTSKTLKAKKPADKLFKSFVGEVYNAMTRDDFRIKRLQDFDEDYTLDDMDKGVPTLATKE